MKQAGDAPRNCVLWAKLLLLEEPCPYDQESGVLRGSLSLGRVLPGLWLRVKFHPEAGGGVLSGTGRIPPFFYYFQLCLKTVSKAWPEGGSSPASLSTLAGVGDHFLLLPLHPESSPLHSLLLILRKDTLKKIKFKDREGSGWVFIYFDAHFFLNTTWNNEKGLGCCPQISLNIKITWAA